MDIVNIAAAAGIVVAVIAAALCTLTILGGPTAERNITTGLQIAAAGLANLVADLAQVEAALGTVGTLAGLAVAASGNNPQVVRVGGLVTASVSVLAVALPKAIAAGRAAETDLETLLAIVKK